MKIQQQQVHVRDWTVAAPPEKKKMQNSKKTGKWNVAVCLYTVTDSCLSSSYSFRHYNKLVRNSMYRRVIYSIHIFIIIYSIYIICIHVFMCVYSLAAQQQRLEPLHFHGWVRLYIQPLRAVVATLLTVPDIHFNISYIYSVWLLFGCSFYCFLNKI